MMKTDIYDDLIKTKSIYEKNIDIYSEFTRDNQDLKVKIDKVTGVISIFFSSIDFVLIRSS